MKITKSDESASLAARIVKRLIADATDRRGWSQEWDGFDADIQREIKRTWRRLVLEEMARKPRPKPKK